VTPFHGLKPVVNGNFHPINQIFDDFSPLPLPPSFYLSITNGLQQGNQIFDNFSPLPLPPSFNLSITNGLQKGNQIFDDFSRDLSFFY
jgi:hypothetical protein